jgi:hypothetical protein
MLYIRLRDNCNDIIVLNVHSSAEDKIDDMKDKFYKKLKHVFNKFHKQKIMLGDFSAKRGMEDIFKPITGNESLHKIRSDNVVKSSKLCHIKKSNC